MQLKIFAIFFVSLLIYVTSSDGNLLVGQRQPGDVLAASRLLYRNRIPGLPRIALSGYNADGNVTLVSAVNRPGSNATIKLVKGGPGTNMVLVMAVSRPSEALDVKLDVYAKLMNKTTVV